MCQIWASYEWPEAPDPEKWTGDYLFVGSKGMVDVQYRGTLRIHRGLRLGDAVQHPPVQQPEPDIEFAYPYAEQVRDFVRRSRQGASRRSTARRRARAIEMAIAADRSAAPGEVVRLPLTA